jgi:WD40 repeat protein
MGLFSVTSERLTTAPCRSLSLDSEGTTLAVTETERLRIRSMGDRSPDRILAAPKGFSNVSISPDGRWAAGGNWRGDQTPVWNLETGKVVTTLLPGTTSVRTHFSPDGKWLLTGSGTDYRLWSVGDWKETSQLKRLQFGGLPGIAGFSQDGELMAATLDHQTIRITQVRDSRVLAHLKTNEPVSFTDLAFDPDKARLVASTSARQIYIWELTAIFKELKEANLDTNSMGNRMSHPNLSSEMLPN